MPFRVVQPYEPDPSVPRHELPLDPERALSCAGDFASPPINTELRRFLFRDAVPLLYAVCVFFAQGIHLYIMWTNDASHPLQLTLQALTVAAFLAVAIVQSTAWTCMSARSARTPMVRQLAATVLVGTGILYVFRPFESVLACGDVDAIGAGGNNATAAEAIAKRQRFCIDVVSVWVLHAFHSSVVVLRVYPQHNIPVITAVFAAYCASYTARPPPTEDNPYDVRGAAGRGGVPRVDRVPLRAAGAARDRSASGRRPHARRERRRATNRLLKRLTIVTTAAPSVDEPGARAPRGCAQRTGVRGRARDATARVRGVRGGARRRGRCRAARHRRCHLHHRLNVPALG